MSVVTIGLVEGVVAEVLSLTLLEVLASTIGPAAMSLEWTESNDGTFRFFSDNAAKASSSSEEEDASVGIGR